jgi:hypothetical protein
MLDVLPLNRKGLGSQSFAGIILTGEGSRKGVNQLDHTGIEWAHVALFECRRAARHRLSRVRFHFPELP